jgi:hypothetical protein
MIKETHSHYSLSKSHLISKNDISVILPCSQKPIKTRYLIVFKSLVFFELWDKVFFKVILEVARRNKFDLSFEQFINKFSSLILIIRFRVNLLAYLDLFLKYFNELFVCIAEARHFLSLVVVKRSVKTLKIFKLIIVVLKF